MHSSDCIPYSPGRSGFVVLNFIVIFNASMHNLLKNATSSFLGEMSHQQPNSSSEAVPSWDEFNVGNDAEEELDYDEDTDPALEAAQDPGEFGPSLPPGITQNRYPLIAQ